MLEVGLSPLRATKGGVWGGKTRGTLSGRGGLGGFCLMLAHFSLLWLIFSIFLRILSHLVFLIHFFGVVARIFEVLGGSGEGFWEVFSMIFDDFFEVLRK